MKKLALLSFIFCFAINAGSQTELNNYKYVIVPLQYDFLKEKDMYRINTLTKYLFKQQGFDAYFDAQDLPEDVSKNRCLAMYVDLKKLNGFLSTKVQIEIRDCKGQLIMTSQIGKTKEKDFKSAYNIAIREAYKTFEFIDYKYEPKPDAETVEKETMAPIQLKDKTTVETKKPEALSPFSKTSQLYYAQKINNGYQLVDSEPKVVMILLHTATNNVFIVKGKDAIVFKENDKWVYSENTEHSKAVKELHIKF